MSASTRPKRAASSATGKCGAMSESSTPGARTLVPGMATGEVLVLDEPLSFWGGLDPETGALIDAHHPQVGASLAGRVLVMPSGRGSSSSSYVLAEAIRAGTAPVAVVLGEADAIVALGAIVAARALRHRGAHRGLGRSGPRDGLDGDGERGGRGSRRHLAQLSSPRRSGDETPRLHSPRGDPAVRAAGRRTTTTRASAPAAAPRSACDARRAEPRCRRRPASARPAARRSVPPHRGRPAPRGAPARDDRLRRPRRIHRAQRPGRPRGRAAASSCRSTRSRRRRSSGSAARSTSSSATPRWACSAPRWPTRTTPSERSGPPSRSATACARATCPCASRCTRARRWSRSGKAPRSGNAWPATSSTPPRGCSRSRREGSVIVGEPTERATRHVVGYEPLPATRVKGKAEPLTAFVATRRARRHARAGGGRPSPVRRPRSASGSCCTTCSSARSATEPRASSRSWASRASARRGWCST